MSTPDEPVQGDRLSAMLGAAATEGDELAALDALIRRIRSADTAADVPVDVDASWRRIEAYLDGD